MLSRIYTLTLLSFAFLFAWFFPPTYATDTNIWSPEFEIQVSDFTPGTERITWWWSAGAVEDANFALWFIIQQMMLFIWGFALFVMTVWAWYIILHRGDDAALSKWKEIFLAGLLGLAVALLSYLMVYLLRSLIYWL